MKPLVTAAAINEKLTNRDELFNCEGGRYKVGKYTVKDVHPSGVISVRDIVVRSSNIGMTKIGMRLGKDKLHEYLTRFGFGMSSGLNLPGESRGILRNSSGWALIDVATHSFGQGVAVTPLQMVRALSTIVNDGLKPELRIVQTEEPRQFTRVVSADVAKEIREMMFAVVEDEHGTGGNAKLEVAGGYRIGGKTGTAQKARADGRGYQSGKYASSFIGFVQPPEGSKGRSYVLLVTVDEPNAKSIYGGVLAAPVFQKVMTRAISLDQRRGA
jgi:cell division protein FtsI (penicillin-binding protein 3)